MLWIPNSVEMRKSHKVLHFHLILWACTAGCSALYVLAVWRQASQSSEHGSAGPAAAAAAASWLRPPPTERLQEGEPSAQWPWLLFFFFLISRETKEVVISMYCSPCVCVRLCGLTVCACPQKLRFFQEEKNREIGALRQRIRELEENQRARSLDDGRQRKKRSCLSRP